MSKQRLPVTGKATGAKIPPELLEAARQSFLAGMSMREVASKHGISLRSVANYAQQGGWTAQRKMQVVAQTVPKIIEAADARAEAINGQWRERMGETLDALGALSLRATRLLSRANLDDMDVRELLNAIRLLVDSTDKVARLLQPMQAVQLNILGDAEAARRTLVNLGIISEGGEIIDVESSDSGERVTDTGDIRQIRGDP